jgi:ribosomal protein L16 Arg81 hydroxylase
MIYTEILNKIKKAKPFYIKNVLNNLFSWEELEKLLNLRPFVNIDRLKIINNKTYKWNCCSWLTEKNSWPPDILQKEIKHYVCYIADSSRVNKKINLICKILEKNLKKPTDAHIYFSFTTKNDEGFGIHNDVSDNIIIQIEGESNIEVWDFEEKSENRFINELNTKSFLNVNMKKGDVIFIPRKHWHRVISKTKRLSISFPMSENENIQQERNWINLERY